MHQHNSFNPLFSLIFCIFAFSTASHATLNHQLESPEKFITQQTTVRACIGNGPNFGDQAATMNVMTRLRQLGFQGTFDVIYSLESVDKVITLFGLPSKLPAIYEDKERKIKFIELETHLDQVKHHVTEFANLGLSVGKADRICDTGTAYTKTFVQFSPYFDVRGDWHDETDIQTWGQDPDNSLGQKDSGKKYFVFPVASYETAKQFLKTDPAGKDVFIKKPALSAFLEGMDNQTFNVLPVYGRTLRFVSQVDELVGSPSPSNMLQTIAGARYAQLTGPADLRKPLVIAVFDNYEKYANELLALIKENHWGDYEKPGAEKAREVIRDLGIVTALSTASVTDPDAINKIHSLQSGQILLLSIGSLPKTAFDGIYTNHARNIWPAVYEGAGTFSTLSLIPTPRFECADTNTSLSLPTWTAGFELIKNPLLKGQMERFYDANDGYCGSIPSGENKWTRNFMRAWQTNVYQTFGQFIIDAHDSNSALNQYFLELNAAALNPDNDRVRYALEDVIKIINNNSRFHHV